MARRVREAHVFCEVHPCDVSSDWVREYAADGNLKGVILSGSHASVYEVDDKAPDAVFELGVPVLGICYGMQTMAAQLGGRVEPGAVHEFGYAEVRARGHSALLRDIEDRVNAEGHGLLDVWMSHGDRVVNLPAGFKAIARRLCVSHANVVPVRWGVPVTVFGREVRPGQLVHADKHGFLVIPAEDEAGAVVPLDEHAHPAAELGAEARQLLKGGGQVREPHPRQLPPLGRRRRGRGRRTDRRARVARGSVRPLDLSARAQPPHGRESQTPAQPLRAGWLPGGNHGGEHRRRRAGSAFDEL